MPCQSLRGPGAGGFGATTRKKVRVRTVCTKSLGVAPGGEETSMPSFDVVSKVQWHEVENAVNQAEKEVGQRFDFKDTGTEVEKTGSDIVVRSSSEERAKAALSVVQEKLVKRKVSLKYFETGKPEPTSKGGAKITVKVKEGIETDKARVIVQSVKDAKLKVQAAIQGDQLRVTGKSRDELQTAIQHLKAQDFGLELQYINFRD